MTIRIRDMTISVSRRTGYDGHVRTVIEVDGYVSMLDMAMIVVIDGLLWFALFAMILGGIT